MTVPCITGTRDCNHLKRSGRTKMTYAGSLHYGGGQLQHPRLRSAPRAHVNGNANFVWKRVGEYLEFLSVHADLFRSCITELFDLRTHFCHGRKHLEPTHVVLEFRWKTKNPPEVISADAGNLRSDRTHAIEDA